MKTQLKTTENSSQQASKHNAGSNFNTHDAIAFVLFVIILLGTAAVIAFTAMSDIL